MYQSFIIISFKCSILCITPSGGLVGAAHTVEIPYANAPSALMIQPIEDLVIEVVAHTPWESRGSGSFCEKGVKHH